MVIFERPCPVGHCAGVIGGLKTVDKNLEGNSSPRVNSETSLIKEKRLKAAPRASVLDLLQHFRMSQVDFVIRCYGAATLLINMKKAAKNNTIV